MKVAIIADYHNQTGIGSQNYNLYLGLQELGVEVDIINLVSPQGFHATPNYGVNIVSKVGQSKYLSFIFGVIYFFKKKLKDLLQKNDYDVVILGHQGLAYLGSMLDNIGQPHILIIDDLFPLYDYAKNLSIWVYKKLLLVGIEKMKYITYISDFTGRDYEKYFPRRDKYISRVIHIGVDIAKDIGEKYKEVIKDKLALKDNQKIVLNVGSEDERKNIAAFLAVAKEFVDDENVLFVRVGRPSIESQIYIQTHGLQNIVYLSRLSEQEIGALYMLSHIVFSPALLEGYGKQIFEGYLYGTFILTSDVSDVKEIFKNDERVHIVHNPHDIHEYKKATANFLHLPKHTGHHSKIQSITTEALDYLDFIKTILSSIH